MYNNILVSIDNSSYSNYAEKIGIALSEKYNAKINGLHVYSGRFHRIRFNKLEDFLPEKYQVEDVLEYQRKIHSVLIERGLEIISYEYMKNLHHKCKQNNIRFEEKLIDGKNTDIIKEELEKNDLLIIGAQGIGEIKNLSKIGSNTRRILRTSSKDIFIAKKPCHFNTILVGIDGSTYSFHVLEKVIDIASKFDSAVNIVSCYDPVLHRNVFSLLTKVLSSEAGNVFKFNEQQELHNMVIDRSLEELYTDTLNKAKKMAEKKGIPITIELLQGKPYYAIYEKSLIDKPDIVAIGRFGMHKGKYDTIGSNAENIAELVDTNVLIVSVKDETGENNIKKTDKMKKPVSSDIAITWSDEAKKRLEHIPKFARPMAILAIERYAKEKEIQIITPEVMKEAREQV
jgi:nucleotide-binding universal stress UspA family protein